MVIFKYGFAITTTNYLSVSADRWQHLSQIFSETFIQRKITKLKTQKPLNRDKRELESLEFLGKKLMLFDSIKKKSNKIRNPF